ncbi:unnamed protein product [Phytophthora fragariaefolia]|uniref:Unnamed protein product n=1 Tax=Phytophthora fragariaefolia TaxID=1490495 RepID=A0A9W7CRL9_9STRA|nr:unnamed protein product [Phytophthora fragariaefolia]
MLILFAIYFSDSRTAVEMILTSFFIVDFGLHLFIAIEPWKFVLSPHGIIDLVTIIPAVIVVGLSFSVKRIYSVLTAQFFLQFIDPGYGDITPHTLLGHVFVIVMIIGIFTIVPAEVNKLNALAKQSNQWGKEVVVRSSGHVIVSGYNLSASSVLVFLQEFYHPTRGSIHLDVVFMSDDPPSSELLYILGKQKYRRRTSYLRGSLMKEVDKCRVKMASATAIFFLANSRHEPAQQDAATILHAVSIRNYVDSCGNHADIYVQLLSRVYEFEMSSVLLGANATKTSELKDMLLARAAVCPGSSTLILNLIRSYHLGQNAKQPSSTLLTASVRVSSDTLWRRRSPRHSFQPTTRSASVRNIRLELSPEQDGQARLEEPVESTIKDTLLSSSNKLKKKSLPTRINQAQSMPSVVNLPSSGSSLYAAILSKDKQKIETVFERDHYRDNVLGLSEHYVICSKSLPDAVSVGTYLRRYARRENKCKISGSNHDQSAECVKIVFLMAYKPAAKDLIFAAEENSANLLRNVLVVVGSPARTNDLVRVEASKAQQLVILPLDKSISEKSEEVSSMYPGSEFGLSDRSAWTDDERMADFGVICSLLAVEITKQGISRSISPRIRRCRSSRLESDQKESPKRSSFKREIEQGIPLESAKIRALGRFPGLDRGVLREKCDIIESVQVDKQKYSAGSAWPSAQHRNTLAVLHYACNAKLCRPCDEGVQDEFPSLTPSFAGGSIFLSSLLNRIVCQSFYNPYITDLIEVLANGSDTPTVDKSTTLTSRNTSNSHSANESPYCRLFDVELENEFVGCAFVDVFLDFVSKEMLVIGVLRHTHSDLENLLPFVYTCPDPATVMHSKERLFVLG